MKCPVCWTEKAYRREVTGWKCIMMKIILLVPMRCHHCYHKFQTFYPLTWGKELNVPALKVAVPHEKLSSRERRGSKQRSRSRTVALPTAEQPARRRRSA